MELLTSVLLGIDRDRPLMLVPGCPADCAQTWLPVNQHVRSKSIFNHLSHRADERHTVETSANNIIENEN